MSVSLAAATKKEIQREAATFGTGGRGFVVPGGVHQLNRSRILQRSEILKNFLNNGQKQREALKALQKLTEQTRLSNSRCLYLPFVSFQSFTFTTPAKGVGVGGGGASYKTQSYEGILMKLLVNIDNWPKNK